MTKTSNIFERLAEVNRKVEAIEKTQRNTQQNFKYRGIDQVLAELHNLFADNEIIVTQKVLDQKREERASRSGGLNIWSIVTYQFTFHAPDGSSVSTEMVGEAMDSGDKGNNKCVSVALKYALIDMFTIPTEEQKQNDPDASAMDLKVELDPQSIERIKQAQNVEELNSIYKELIAKEGMQFKSAIIRHCSAKKSELGEQ